MFTPLKISIGTPNGVLPEIQGQQSPINELNGAPPLEASPISNLHRFTGFSVKQHGHHQFSIKMNNNMTRNKHVLFESIIRTEVLPFSFVDEYSELYFQAETVCMLDEFLEKYEKKNNKKNPLNQVMKHDCCVRMVECLSKQIQYLEANGYSFFGFDLKDIFVVDNSIFVIGNDEMVLPIYKSFDKYGHSLQKLTFFSPVKKPYFSNPEFIVMKQLPGFISSKSCYYSLAVLIVYFLLGKHLLENGIVKSVVEIEEILQPIQFTKLYWFLKRCLHKYSEERNFLYI
jgi:hypothetical protein